MQIDKLDTPSGLSLATYVGSGVASISITGSIFTMTQDRIENELAARVVKAADSISGVRFRVSGNSLIDHS